jgi:hypothetical protein
MFSSLLNWQGAELSQFHVCRLTAFFNCAKILSSPPIRVARQAEMWNR